MFEVNSTISSFGAVYTSMISQLPSWAQSFINLFLILMVILLYLLFVHKFYNSISKKNILGLDLNQYNKYERPFFYKIYSSFLFLVEYIIILPLIIFFWFSALSLFLLLLTNITISTVFLISAVIVIVTRMTCYYNRELSENIAKLIPFTLLSIALLTPNFFNFESIINHFTSLPEFFGQIIIYLIFIIAFEIILRMFDFIISLFDTEETEDESQEVQDTEGQQTVQQPQN